MSVQLQTLNPSSVSDTKVSSLLFRLQTSHHKWSIEYSSLRLQTHNWLKQNHNNLYKLKGWWIIVIAFKLSTAPEVEKKLIESTSGGQIQLSGLWWNDLQGLATVTCWPKTTQWRCNTKPILLSMSVSNRKGRSHDAEEHSIGIPGNRDMANSNNRGMVKWQQS